MKLKKFVLFIGPPSCAALQTGAQVGGAPPHNTWLHELGAPLNPSPVCAERMR